MRRHGVLALLISAVFVYLFVFQPAPGDWLAGRAGWREALLSSRVAWGEVGRLLITLRPLPFAGAVAFLVLSLALRAWRWRVVVGPLARLPVVRLFHLTNLGYMANNLLPMRLGEVLRAGALALRSPVPPAGALATIVVERTLDVIGALAVLLLMLLCHRDLAATGAASPEALAALARFRDLAPALGLGTGAALALMLALVIWRRRCLEALERVLNRLLPDRPAARLHRILSSFAAGLDILRSPWEGLLLLAQTALVYACYLGSLACMIHAYGLGETLVLFQRAPAASLLLVLVFVSLGYMIPAAPGAFGTVQYFTALAMGLVGAGTEAAMSFALGNHLITWLVLTLLGLAALPQLGLRFNDLIQWKEKGA